MLDALDRIPADAFDIVILDEAQRIKNCSSRTAFACRLLPRVIAWALTGTPIENSRSDLESIFEFLRPGLVRPTAGKARVLSAIAPHFLRRRKAEVGRGPAADHFSGHEPGVDGGPASRVRCGMGNGFRWPCGWRPIRFRRRIF